MKIQYALALAIFALTPVAAAAETQEEQQACTNDAFNVCGDFIPDRERVAACLAQNINRISPACRTVMQRYQPQPAATVASTQPAMRTHKTKSHAGKTLAHAKAKARANKGPLNIKPTRAASQS
jgi:hypothetical protein